jgi:hypothetical protein
MKTENFETSETRSFEKLFVEYKKAIENIHSYYNDSNRKTVTDKNLVIEMDNFIREMEKKHEA